MDGRLKDATLRSLADAFLARDPGLLVVRERIVRRVVKATHGLRSPGLQVPHPGCLATSREVVLAHVAPDELPAAPAALPPAVILVGLADLWSGRPRDELLRLLWARAFHAQVDATVDSLALSDAAIRARVDTLGQVAFDEVRAVLRDEELLVPPATDRAAYRELAALLLELSAFAPERLASTFPGLEDLEAARRLVRRDLEVAMGEAPSVGAPGQTAEARLLEATRPVGVASTSDGALAGSPAPTERRPEGEGHAAGDAEDARSAMGARGDGGERAAEDAAARGNLARAAMRWARRGRAGDAAAARRARHATRQLVGALAATLEVDAERLTPLTVALDALLTQGHAEGLSQGARLLADLQRAAEASRRPPWRLDLWGWIASRGARPWRRPLPGRLLARVLHHLRAAQRRAFRAAGAGPAGRRLREALGDAVALAAARLHAYVRRGVVAAMEAAREEAPGEGEPLGRGPRNPARCLLGPSGSPGVPWRLARDRVAAALADAAVKRGYTQLGDLRDHVAAGDAKLPDLLSVPGARLADPLLRLDRALARRLGGVHRRGEIYLRALQRASSAVFGTPPGRLLTRFVLLPFGGAFVALEGLQHLAHAVVAAAGSEVRVHLTGLPAVLALGAFLLGLLHAPMFRGALVAGLRALGRGLRWALVVAPARFLRLPWVRRVLDSPAARALGRVAWRLARAAPLGVLGWALARPVGGAGGDGGGWGGLAGGGAGLVVGWMLVESRLGRSLEEGGWDLLARTWVQARDHFFPGLYRAVMEGFTWAVDQVERRLYAVDEALRFRGGDGPLAIASKLVGGGVWRVIAYLTRLYVNLLIEPQVNPIKHFPVVTVSHKIILPMSVQLTEALAVPLVPALGEVVGTAVAATTVLLLPGVFGFLVWELKANWRLYDANRPPTLGPQTMGSHSETVARLVRPGFHTGTLPKAFRRLRRAQARGQAHGRQGRRAWERVDHVREDVRRFTERSLLAVWHELGPLRANAGFAPRVVEVALSSNRVRVAIEVGGASLDGGPDAGTSPGPLVLALEEQSGWLVASVPRPGWTATLDDRARRAIAVGLAGFFAWAGVDVTRARIQEGLPPGARYDIDDRGLVVWPGPGYEREVRARLTRSAGRVDTQGRGDVPVESVEAIVQRVAAGAWLGAHPIPWEAWAAALVSPAPNPRTLVGDYRLVPWDS